MLSIIDNPYSIPISLLKILSSHITKPLCTIINDSFSSGVFPNSLKLAKVIPLHKKGATDVPSNYRPISLLSIFSKVIEKLMHKRLFEFLEYCNILHPLQFGFCEKHSTLHALIRMTETSKKQLIMVCLAVVYVLIFRKLLIQLITRS